MDRFACMATFVKVVELGSLSAASRALGMSLASVSRQIASLEDTLDARLLSRTTRQLALTEGGRGYYERAKRILGDLDEAELSLAHQQSVPSGRLTVSAPVLFGRHYLAAILPEFMLRHPKVAVDLTMVDRFVNLVEEGVDVAVRIGRLADSSLVARQLGTFRRVVCAAPGYLAERGSPSSPDELARHDCLAFSMLEDAETWRFGAPGRDVVVRIAGRLRANNADAVILAALGGAGLALAPSWQIREHVAAGSLCVVLRDFEPPPVPIHVVFPHPRLLSAKVRAFVDFLAERWAAEDFGRI